MLFPHSLLVGVFVILTIVHTGQSQLNATNITNTSSSTIVNVTTQVTKTNVTNRNTSSTSTVTATAAQTNLTSSDDEAETLTSGNTNLKKDNRKQNKVIKNKHSQFKWNSVVSAQPDSSKFFSLSLILLFHLNHRSNPKNNKRSRFFVLKNKK